MPLRRVERPAPEATQYAAPETDDSLFEEEDENEQSAESASLQSGWATAQKLAEQSKRAFSKDLKVTNDPVLVAFLEGGPVDSYQQHWINGRKGQKSFRCASTRGGGACPLCKAGDKPGAKFVFFVLEFVFDGENIEPIAQVWSCGIRVFEQLRAIDTDPRKGGPLQGHFFAVSRSGESTDTVYSIVPVKPRDLADDWGIDGDDAIAAVAEARATEKPELYSTPLSKLEEVAAELRK